MRLLIPALLLLSVALVAESADVVCGSGKTKKTVTLRKADSVAFSTQAGARYGKKANCAVIFKRPKKQKCKLTFSCSSFDLTAANSGCTEKSDFILISKKKYCQSTSPSVTVTGTKLKVLFKSHKKSRGGVGATCTASCTSATPPATTAAPGASFLPASDPGNLGGWVIQPKLTDEFSGEFDRTKWRPHAMSHGWPGRAPAQFASKNVATSGGLLVLTTMLDPDYSYSSWVDDDCLAGQGDTCCLPALAPTDCGYHTWTSAYVESKATLVHGYVEIRSKSANASITSSFWFVQADDARVDSEIDVFESMGNPTYSKGMRKKYPTDLHCGGKFENYEDYDPEGTSSNKEYKLDFSVADDFHVYGLEWDAEHIVFYVDGRKVRESRRDDPREAWCFTQPLQIALDSEHFWWCGDPLPETLPAKFQVDYVRTWKRSQ